jgi:hypothetical protein
MLRQPLRRFAFIWVSEASVKFDSFPWWLDRCGFLRIHLPGCEKVRVLFTGWPLLSTYFFLKSCSIIAPLCIHFLARLAVFRLE